MITLDFWDVFSVGPYLYVIGTDLSSYEPKAIKVESIDLDSSTFYCFENRRYKFGWVQGFNITNMNFFNNWLIANNINKNEIKKYNIFE